VLTTVPIIEISAACEPLGPSFAVRTAELDLRAAGLDQRSLALDLRAAEIDRRVFVLEQQSLDNGLQPKHFKSRQQHKPSKSISPILEISAAVELQVISKSIETSAAVEQHEPYESIEPITKMSAAGELYHEVFSANCKVANAASEREALRQVYLANSILAKSALVREVGHQKFMLAAAALEREHVHQEFCTKIQSDGAVLFLENFKQLIAANEQLAFAALARENAHQEFVSKAKITSVRAKALQAPCAEAFFLETLPVAMAEIVLHNRFEALSCNDASRSEELDEPEFNESHHQSPEALAGVRTAAELAELVASLDYNFPEY
jgi:hypothetical protein